MRFLLAALALVAVAACGDGTTATDAPTSTTTIAGTTLTTVTEATTPTEGAQLPPSEFSDLAPLLEPYAASLGFTVTRAALVDLGTYQTSAEGTHLAVYLVATTERTPDEVAQAVIPMAALFLPEVFERWPGLLSFDVCQEPFDSAGDPSVPSDTIVNVSREDAAFVDWDTVTLAELHDIAQSREGFTLYAAPEIEQSTTWTAATQG